MSKATLGILLVAVALTHSVEGQSGVDEIQFDSQGSRVHGRVFRAPAAGARPTLLIVPGWPGSPQDVLSLGETLPPLGVNMVMFNPRGMHASEGTFGFENTVNDIGAVLTWLAGPQVQERFRIDPARIVLGGYSFGGGMAAVYAARNDRVRRLISISGSDSGDLVERILTSPPDALPFREMLSAPGRSPVRISSPEDLIETLRKSGNVYRLRDTASAVADRSILLIGGWEDVTVTVDQTVLPYYRALKKAGAKDVTFLVYHADHQFGSVRRNLASDIANWIGR